MNNEDIHQHNERPNEAYNIWQSMVKDLENEKNSESQTESDKNLETEDFAREQNDANSEINNDIEIEKTREDREAEDLGVLFSLFDKKECLEIYKSDSYKTLSENGVSLLDLFNANALFNEQYYSDGFPLNDDEDRRYERAQGNGYDITEAIRKYERNTKEKWQLHEYLYLNNKNKDRETLRDLELDRSGPHKQDKNRAHEAKHTIDDIAKFYFGENVENDKTSQFLSTVKTRANFLPLSDEQKDFLQNEHNVVADRLLYEGKVVDENRANNLFNFLDTQDERQAQGKATGRGEEFYFAKTTIDDYIEAGKPELVANSIKKMKDLVDEHFEDVIDDTYIDNSTRREIILDYSEPLLLLNRAQKYNLVDFIHPDALIETIARDFNGPELGSELKLFISDKARELKELGVSDEVILEKCRHLGSPDFIDSKSTYDGSGAKLIEAGVDKKKIIREVFNSSGWLDSPFKILGYPFKNENLVDTLERNGFDMTDIAKTFSPDAIAKNLSEFIERGADVKELLKHMASYHEEFEKNIVRNMKGDATEFRRMWYDGYQDMIVWDENHPNGREICKVGMKGDGIDYVAANLDIFANNGATEEDVFGAINDSEASPYNMFISRAVECRKFDTQKVLSLGFQKYKKFLETEYNKAGSFISEDYLKSELEPNNYYSTIIKNLGVQPKAQRDEYYNSLMSDKKSI